MQVAGDVESRRGLLMRGRESEPSSEPEPGRLGQQVQLAESRLLCRKLGFPLSAD